MLQPEKITSLFADAYREAVLGRVNMRKATEVLETMRSAMLSESEIFATWNILDVQINQFGDAQELLPILITLRGQWQTIILNDECKRLQDIFEELDSETGWSAWLHSFVDALVQFRLDFAHELCKAPLPFPDDSDPTIIKIRLLTERARHARWAEAFDLYAKLGENETVIPNFRVQLLTIASDISGWHFRKFDQAKAFLDRAEELGIKDWRLLYSWSKYYFWQPGKENQIKAREYSERLIDKYPDVSLGYTSLGELLEKENDLLGAAENYEQAAKCHVAPSDGYAALLVLCSQKSHYEQHRDEIPLLVKRFQAVALSELDHCQAFINAGYAYELNDEAEKAHSWYRQAIIFDDTRPQGYISEAYLYLNNQDYQSAANRFQQAIKVAPEAVDGYWGMSRLTEEKQEWEAAINWYEESLERRPQWGGFIHARIGNIKRELGKPNIAAQEYIKALTVEPNNIDARNGIEGIADDLYKDQGDMEGALQLYQQLREVVGADYESRFHNLVGHIYFYFGQYQVAADQYRQAIAAEPKTARYHSNLALAIERYRTTGQIVEELNKAIDSAQCACDLEPDEDEYTEQLYRLELERNIVRDYGELVSTFEPRVKPILVHVENSALNLVLDAEGINLSTNFSKKIMDMRHRIQAQSMLNIPGVRFDNLETPAALSGDYQIDIIGQQVAYGQIELGSRFVLCSKDQLNKHQRKGKQPYLQPVVGKVANGYWLDESNWTWAKNNEIEMIEGDTYFVLHLEAVILKYLDRLCGYQQAFNLLKQSNSDECFEISRNPRLLNDFTTKLRRILGEGKSITNQDTICEKLLQESPTSDKTMPQPDQDAPESTSEIRSLALYISPTSPLNREDLEKELINLQATLFEELGVVIPLIELSKIKSIEPNDFQLQIDDHKLPMVAGLSLDELWVFVPHEDVKDRFPDSRETIEPNSLAPATILKSVEEVRQYIKRNRYDIRDPLGYVIFCIAAELRRRRAQLLNVELVKFFLVKLKQDYPDLINTVSQYYTEQVLTYHLKEKLKTQTSIKNLPIVLENLLVEMN